MKLVQCSNCGKIHLSSDCLIKTVTTTLSNDTCYDECIEKTEFFLCPLCKGMTEEINDRSIGSITIEDINDIVNRFNCDVNIDAFIDDNEYITETHPTLAEVNALMSANYCDITNIAYDGDTLYIVCDIFRKEV